MFGAGGGIIIVLPCRPRAASAEDGDGRIAGRDPVRGLRVAHANEGNVQWADGAARRPRAVFGAVIDAVWWHQRAFTRASSGLAAFLRWLY
jgi:hypothetical protein